VEVTGAELASRRSMETPLRIAVVEENPPRAEILIAGLSEAGHPNVIHIDQTKRLLQALYDIDPDVVIIGLENPSRDTLEQLFQMSRVVKRPIAMFVDKSDRAAITAAIDAGVSAYIVGGLKRSVFNPSSTYASRVSTPRRACKTNWRKRKRRWRNAR